MQPVTPVSPEATRAAIAHCCPVVHPEYGRASVLIRDDGRLLVACVTYGRVLHYDDVSDLAADGWRVDPTDRVGRAMLALDAFRARCVDGDEGYAAGGLTWRGSPGVSVAATGRTIPGRRRWVLSPWMTIAALVFVAPGEEIPMRGCSGKHPDEDLAGSMPDPQWFVLECLTHLDPTDDTRLLDGSRRIDAEALVLVSNHIHGGTDAD